MDFRLDNVPYFVHTGYNLKVVLLAFLEEEALLKLQNTIRQLLDTNLVSCYQSTWVEERRFQLHEEEYTPNTVIEVYSEGYCGDSSFLELIIRVLNDLGCRNQETPIF